MATTGLTAAVDRAVQVAKQFEKPATSSPQPRARLGDALDAYSAILAAAVPDSIAVNDSVELALNPSGETLDFANFLRYTSFKQFLEDPDLPSQVVQDFVDKEIARQSQKISSNLSKLAKRIKKAKIEKDTAAQTLGIQQEQPEHLLVGDEIDSAHETDEGLSGSEAEVENILKMVAGEGAQPNHFRDRNIDDEEESDNFSDEEPCTTGHGEEDDLLGLPLSAKQLALLYGDVDDVSEDEEVE